MSPLWKVLIIGVSILLALLLVATVGIGWYFSGQVIDVSHTPPDRPLLVEARDENTVTLPRTPETERPGSWGLEWDGGEVQLGEIVESTDDSVTREVTGVQVDELVPRMSVRVDTWVYDGDPKTAHGIDFAAVDVPSPVGELPSWHIPGEGSTWVIAVHGRNASPGEALRIIPELADLGFPTLAMTYRNDENAPPAPDGKHHLGDTEWEDVAAAVEYARGQGATGVALYGWSMGGSVVMTALRRMDDPGFVRGVILDSAVLDWASTLDKQGRARGLPMPLIAAAKLTVELRTGMRLGDLDQRPFAPDLEVPILLFSDTIDDAVDLDVTREFAEAGGDLVTMVETSSGHTASWNENPERYESAVRDFLTALSDQ